MEGKGLKEVGLDSKTKRTVIKIDKRYFRPNELHYLKGIQKGIKKFKMEAKNISKGLIKEMIDYDIQNQNY